MPGERPWAELIAPIVMHFDVAAAFNKQACWDAEGARACSIVWKRMAQIIDDEIKVRPSKDLIQQRAALHHDTTPETGEAGEAGT